ncbi:single-strand binding protein [Persephonella hydrogeniphila]|uniref:Single-stranded DNA-binding protein n=1 Tax=Persephonella hydrogeniphila TaxID=198703 RepID=A0A285NGS7_9AQUI|nr:single-stranded DNA-binding protein [Persephonella hydrogeniphila]SNZ08704.1 single-strand binding protein [Persephonella hydrogeniphila]
MLNKVFLIGRLTRDPEIRFLPSGSQVTSFTLAVNRSYRVNNEWKEETYFFDIEAFGSLAERLGKQLNKGTQILVEGQLRQDRWETASGEKRTKVKVVAEKVNIISGKTSEKPVEKEEEPELDITTEPEDFSSDEDVPF